MHWTLPRSPSRSASESSRRSQCVLTYRAPLTLPVSSPNRLHMAGVLAFRHRHLMPRYLRVSTMRNSVPFAIAPMLVIATIASAQDWYQPLPPLEMSPEENAYIQQRMDASPCGYGGGLPPLNVSQEEYNRWDKCTGRESARSRADQAQQQQRDRREEEANERDHQNQLRRIDRFFR